ncbi:MAG TPA: glycosyltransferase family 2 protein [Planctomycetota bacterium]|nr:glycosyltransferase family 2 protein [Planctomycetota bacterium]
MTPPAVTVVLVNWNGAEFLPPCLRSIAAQTYAGAVNTIVVDNGSHDGSLELLRRDFPEVRVLVNDVNNYARANNRGVAAADTPFVLQLNTDTELEPECIARLVDRLAARPDAAAAMPKILYPDGRLYSTGVLQRPDLYWVDRDEGEPDDGRRDREEDLFGVSGCCALHRREVWLAAGGLDEAFHMYYEDVEFSLRLRARGHALLYVPAARVRHVGHGSIAKTAHGKDVLGERNRLLVLAAHYRDAFPRECVRSPWFQSAPPDELRALLPELARRLGVAPEAAWSELCVALRDAVREFAGEQDAAYGTHRNYPRILEEREQWIEKLLREVARLRIYRWPWRRLKPGEQAFLRARRARRDDAQS